MATVELRQLSANLTRVYVGQVTLWFSYETCVAFQAPGSGGRVVSQNVWSNTTAKHLTAIDGGTKEAKAARTPHGEFRARLIELMDRLEEATSEVKA